MGEKKTTLLEINIEDAGGFAFSPHLGGDLGERLEEYEEKGSNLGLFGAEEETTSENEDEDENASGGLFSRSSGDESEADETGDTDATEVDVEDAEEGEGSSGGLSLVIGLLFLLVVAAVAKKTVIDGETEEYEEVELSEYEN